MSDYHSDRARISDLERRVATLESSLAGALREIEILKVSAELYARHAARDMLTAHPVIFSRSDL